MTPTGTLEQAPGSKAKPVPPGPKGYPVVGILPRIWRDPLRFFCDVAREHGGLARMGVGRFTLYLVSDPELIEHVFHGNWRNYWKGEGMAAAKAVTGEGLATSEGDHWHRQRRMIQPAFSSRRVAALLPGLRLTMQQDLGRWDARARTGQSFDIAEEMQHLLLKMICRTLFGAGVDSVQAEEIGKAALVACGQINHLAWRLIPLPESIPTPRNVRFRRAMKLLEETVYTIIDQRRGLSAPPQDLLGHMLAARDDKGLGMTQEQLRDEVMTMFVAGHETPANALAWTFHLLTQHPDVARRVEEEVDGVLGGRPPELEDLDQLDLLERVIKESLRLYPPAWVIVRTAHEDDVLGGYHVPAGAPLLLSQYVIHRHPDLWDEPDRFDPERWTEERSANRPRYAYFPFGGGVRYCLGNILAMMMMKLVVATVTQRYRLEPEPGHRVVPQPMITLRPKHGVRVIARARPQK